MKLSRVLRIIQTEVSVLCRSEAEDNADRGLNYSDILRKRNSIILNYSSSTKNRRCEYKQKSNIFFTFFFKNNGTFEINARYR